MGAAQEKKATGICVFSDPAENRFFNIIPLIDGRPRRLHFPVLSSLKRTSSLCGLLAALLVLPGCLPEDSLQLLQFSPDGKKLAVISEKNGLRVADPAAMESVTIAPGNIDASGVAWTSDSLRLAYVSEQEGSLDVYISDLDAQTTRVTSMPSRETSPMIHGDALFYITTESGLAALTSYSLTQEPLDYAPLVPSEADMINPTLSPDGKRLAFFSYDDLRPQLFCTDLTSGVTTVLTKESDPFNLMTTALTWSHDSRRLGYLRNPVGKPVTGAAEADGDEAARDYTPLGSLLMVRTAGDDAPEQTLVKSAAGIHSPRLLADGSAVFISEKKLHLFSQTVDHVLAIDLPAANPAVGGAEDNLAFAVSDQLIALTSATLEKARILTFDLEEKFLLAEEYFRSGSRTKSYSLYEELAGAVQRARDPQLARFIYIANLRRLGRTEQAVAEIEQLLRDGLRSESVEEKYLWRLLGYSYLLELNDPAKATASFQKYRELTSETIPVSEPDSALNALQILKTTTGPVQTLYASAIKARLDGDFPLTDKLFGELLTTAPAVKAVQREYINALDGFDREVYYFTPSQRPFQPTRLQKAEYLQRFVDTVTTPTALTRTARLDLFLLRIEMGSYSRARALLDEALTSAPLDSRPEGILEVFRNFLETPEPQPWINAAMPEVFLHPQIRPRLEALTQDPEDRLLMAVAATKMALLANDPDAARREANSAVAEWNKLSAPNAVQPADVAGLYGRLLVLRAREAELRGLYAEAAEGYDQAVKLLQDQQVNNFEMQEEIRYRSSLLRMVVTDFPALTDKIKRAESLTGVELVNPSWDQKALQDGVREYLEVYDTTTNTLKLWAAYEAGECLGKLQRTHQARSALLVAISGSAPAFVQRKAMVELAAIDEYLGDPWNAARWYAKLAALPDAGADVRLWCSYQIARLHISINYKVSAAREALAVIVSTRPEIPLAVQAQELLISTGTR